jgi:TPR repeat protein
MNLLADCYNYGWGCEKNKTERLNWLKYAFNAGSMEACAKLAYCYEKGDGVPMNQKKL